MKTYNSKFLVLVFVVLLLSVSGFAELKTDTTQFRYVRFESTLSADYTRLALQEIKVFYDGDNIAQGKSITASRNSYDSNVSKVVDGNESSGWSSDDYISLTNDNGNGPTTNNPHYIIVDLGMGYNLESLKLDLNGGGNWSFDYTFDFLVSADSTNWSLVDHKGISHGLFTYTNLPIQNVRYIKYACYYSSDYGQVNVEEIQAFSNGVNVALRKSAKANSGWSGSAAVDGDSSSRWSSNRRDHIVDTRDATAPIYVQVDLGEVQAVDSLQLTYHSATVFTLLVSANGNEWLKIDKRLNDQNKYTYVLNHSIKMSSAITAFTDTTATCTSNIKFDAGSDIIARGVCWSTSPNPTVLDSKISNGTGLGSYVTTLTGLVGNNFYYVRAYATNATETKYSKEESFLCGFTSVETDVVSYSNSIVTAGGNINATDAIPISARGVCWSTNKIPTILDDRSDNGRGSGEFTTNLPELYIDNIYYYRAYAVTDYGTFYGKIYSFSYPKLQYLATGGTYDGGIFSNYGMYNGLRYFGGNNGGSIYFYDSNWAIDEYYFTSESGNPPLTGWSDGTELSLVIQQYATVTYNKSSLTEYSLNDGSFMEILSITHDNTNGASFAGDDNEDFVETGKAVVRNLPAGLTAHIVRNNSLSLTLSLTGNAAAHAKANDVSNVKVMLFSDAFTDGSTLLTTGNYAQLSLNYNEQVQLTTGTKICSDNSIAPLAFIRNSSIIISNLAHQVNVRLYDVSGRIIFNNNIFEKDTYEIPLKSSGMYVIQIDTNTGSWKFKLLNNQLNFSK